MSRCAAVARMSMAEMLVHQGCAGPSWLHLSGQSHSNSCLGSRVGRAADGGEPLSCLCWEASGGDAQATQAAQAAALVQAICIRVGMGQGVVFGCGCLWLGHHGGQSGQLLRGLLSIPGAILHQKLEGCLPLLACSSNTPQTDYLMTEKDITAPFVVCQGRLASGSCQAAARPGPIHGTWHPFRHLPPAIRPG